MAGASPRRKAILDPIDRISEILFGLLMALSFTGAVSVGSDGGEDVRTVLFAALGCNIAWGLIDAVMYVVRTQIARGRELSLLRAVRDAGDTAAANALVEQALPAGWVGGVSPEMLDALRKRLLALPDPPRRTPSRMRVVVEAAAIFFLVVLATFPVVVPFIVFDDVFIAMRVSNGIAILMLFAAGYQLGRHAGLGGARTGLWMVGLGLVMVAAIVVFGG